MGHGVAHLICERQGQLRVGCSELRIVLLDIVAGLTDDLEVPDHGILDHLVLQEWDLAHVLGVAVDTLDGFEDVRQVVR